MKNILFAVVIATVPLFSSCLTSLHPLVTSATVITDNRIVGNWDIDGDLVRISKFTESDPYKGLIQLGPLTGQAGKVTPQQRKEDSIMFANGYSISFRKDGIKYFMFGALTRIGSDLFCDLIPVLAENPEDKESTGYEYTNDYLPTLTMARLVVVDNNNLTLTFLDGDFIKEQFKNGRAGIKHEQDELFGTSVVTASPQQLKQFLEKYSHDERLFSKTNSVTLIRKG